MRKETSRLDESLPEQRRGHWRQYFDDDRDITAATAEIPCGEHCHVQQFTRNTRKFKTSIRSELRRMKRPCGSGCQSIAVTFGLRDSSLPRRITSCIIVAAAQKTALVSPDVEVAPSSRVPPRPFGRSPFLRNPFFSRTLAFTPQTSLLSLKREESPDRGEGQIRHRGKN